ncbi:MAG: asparagine synthase-related protein, partial [Polymorphobacter sp.]
RRDAVRIVTDAIGLSHVYVAQADGVVAASSSALALAQLFGLGIDAAALYAMAQTGSMVGSDTPFAGVRKLAAGVCATLRAGQLHLEVPVEPETAAPARGRTVAAVAAEGATLLRQIMTELSENFPAADLELSGGLDSRLLLAALPAALRARHRGFTIGDDGAADVIVARQLAAAAGLSHVVANADAELAAADFPALLAAVTRDYQFSANPLDRALIAALSRRYPLARFSGQNGEALRGFYYAGQQLDAAPTRTLAQRLVDWRLISNDAVDPALFAPEFSAAQRPALRARLTALVLDCPGGRWAAKLDWLYERERMQHWCGIGISGVQHERQILTPFFDARLTAFARSVAPQAKSGARLAAAMLVELDPALARLRLDSGLSPLALAAGGGRSLLTRTRVNAAKAGRKIGQRLRRAPASTVSATSATTMFWQQIGATGIDVAALHGWGLFDSAMLDRFARGDWQPDRPTLGFLINCAALATALGHTPAAPIGGGTIAPLGLDRGQPIISSGRLLAASE